jgi:UDP-N-acetylmuramoyl-L-alanyl-D-glutamate--2,6-diaminopimelate ligase
VTTRLERAEPVPGGDAPTLGGLLARLRERGIACRTSLSPDLAIGGVQIDSRKVGKGDLFVALPGSCADGFAYARDALRAGAVAVVSEGDGVGQAELPGVHVADAAAAAGHIAAIVAGEPSATVGLVGVTGTNGKTSCTYLLESVWRAAGVPCGVGGTIDQRGPGFARPARLTTPDPIELQSFLAELRDAGARWAALEVSSHALSQKRIAGCSFRAAIFTNLTRDHLDYHADEEAYFAAKLSLFTHYLQAPEGVAVLNAADSRSAAVAGACSPRRVVTYSAAAAAKADVVAKAGGDSRGPLSGSIVANGCEIRFVSQLFGEVNLANIAAVAAAGIALGVDPAAIAAGIEACEPVPGRFERVGSGDPAVFVDYAHTPDALERTLMGARRLCRGRLVTVFGCGGDRDRGKRPVMGEIAGRLADVAVLTSDNPRSEDPAAILGSIEEGVAPGLEKSGAGQLARDGTARGYLVEPDRERAIRAAIALAHSADVVVVAGKGHEDYQEIAGVRRPFDDRAVVRRILEGV